MRHRLACLVPLACTLVAGRVAAAPIAIAPCEGVPESVAALAPGTTLESFGIAARADVAVVTRPSSADPSRSELFIVRDGGEPRSVSLAGRVLGIVASDDGALAYAIVRTSDRKGALRSVDLVRVDLATGKPSSAQSLPASARGIALVDDGAGLVIASRDELRTFRLPTLSSGPLYRVLGENLGVALVAGSSRAVVVQAKRAVCVDLASAQGRDGLAFSQETVPPSPLRGLMSSAGAAGPVALSESGEAFCVRVGAPDEPVPPIVPVPVAPPDAPAPSEAAAAVPVAVAPAETPPPPPPPPPQDLAAAPVAPPAEPVPAAQESPANPTESGTVFGSLEGPAVDLVAAVILLGPDNILHEAARAAPDGDKRYRVSGLAAGTYRLVAAGKGGRVLICDPSFITLRVGGNGAVPAPVLKVLRAP